MADDRAFLGTAYQAFPLGVWKEPRIYLIQHLLQDAEAAVFDVQIDSAGEKYPTLRPTERLRSRGHYMPPCAKPW